MVRVKICGITNLEDAIASALLGCDALGFVFYKKSPRYITPKKAKIIARIIPRHILKVGVFVNAKEKTIKRIARMCKLDMLQFHGNESAEFCNKFKGYKTIKAFRVKDKLDLQNILKYKPSAYLFDTFVRLKMGGTGKKFNWQLLRREMNNIKIPVFLSGGLNKDNIRQAMKIIHPDWVDVSSAVEKILGKKDHKKIKEFIEAIKTKTGF